MTAIDFLGVPLHTRVLLSRTGELCGSPVLDRRGVHGSSESRWRQTSSFVVLSGGDEQWRQLVFVVRQQTGNPPDRGADPGEQSVVPGSGERGPDRLR